MDDTLYRGGSGEPLVLLHGFTGSWHIWKPVLPVLEASYDVIALTLPGHLGWTWPEDRQISVASVADLVHDRLLEIGVGRAHVAGNSLGGWVALALAARGQAQSVTAFSPGGGWRPDEERVQELFRKMRTTIEQAHPAAEAFLADPDDRRRLLGIVLERGDLVPVDEAVRMWQAVLAVEDLDAVLDGLLAEFVADGLPRPGAEPPHSIVWCGEDHLLPETGYSEGWREAAPHAEWSVLEGAGHVPMYDDPEGVVLKIKQTTARA